MIVLKHGVEARVPFDVCIASEVSLNHRFCKRQIVSRFRIAVVTALVNGRAPPGLSGSLAQPAIGVHIGAACEALQEQCQLLGWS